MKEKKSHRTHKRIKESIIFLGNEKAISGNDFEGLRILIDREATRTGKKHSPDFRVRGTKKEDIQSLSQKEPLQTRKSGSHSLAELRHFKSPQKW